MNQKFLKEGSVWYYELFEENYGLAEIIIAKNPESNIEEKISYFFNEKGELKFKIEYDKNVSIEPLSPFRDDIFIFDTKNENDERLVQIIQKINEEKNTILHEFEWIEQRQYEGTIAVGKNGKYGFMDIDGNLFIDCEYDDYYNFYLGAARVEADSKWYAINKKGQKIEVNIDMNKWYEEIDMNDKEFDHKIVSNNFSDKNINNKYGLIDSEGEIILNCIYDRMEEYGDYFKAMKNGKWGFIEKGLKPKEMFEFRFEDEYDLGVLIDDFAIVRENNTYEVIDRQGKVVYSSPNKMYNLGRGIILAEQENEYELVDVKKLNS